MAVPAALAAGLKIGAVRLNGDIEMRAQIARSAARTLIDTVRALAGEEMRVVHRNGLDGVLSDQSRRPLVNWLTHHRNANKTKRTMSCVRRRVEIDGTKERPTDANVVGR